MSKDYPPNKDFSSKAYVSSVEEYNRIYKRSIDDPDSFWIEKAKDLDWIKFPTHSFNWINKERKLFSWFEDGQLNACYNCVDRHLKENSDKIAITWISHDLKETKKINYKQLHELVSKFSNVLKSKGVKKGDRVSIYLPMIPELIIAVLSCARIGAIHSVIFAGYSVPTIKDRIDFAESKLLITSDGAYRAGKVINFIDDINLALEGNPTIESKIIVRRINLDLKLKQNEYFWDQEMESEKISKNCDCQSMNAEDPLFILFNSGTVEKPKGTLHTTGGYLLYVNQTFKYNFDYHKDDVYFCTADIGWITGHSYMIYGPLSNLANVIMFEGIPTYPDNESYWKIIQDYKVNIFYTAPTVVRSLMRFGKEPLKKYNLKSLKLLGSVGEPINPEAWFWYFDNVGNKNCPIVDTWWQTESGGFLIAPFPGAFTLKPGFATKPFFGIEAEILRDDFSKAEVNEPAIIVIKKPWPAMMRTIYKDHQLFLDIYWSKFKDYYFCGDRAKVDEDGDYFIIGRLDDVIKVSGHRIGASEVESALVSNKNVGEAAVVPFPHKIKGQAMHAFIILREGVVTSDNLVAELKEHVSKEIGPIAKPDKIQIVKALPKTSSGKIIRRILRAIAYDSEDYGDLSTLVNPETIDQIKLEKI